MKAMTTSKTEPDPHVAAPHRAGSVAAATEALEASWPGVLRQPGEPAYDD
jgi:hypothetical protein